MAAARPMPPTTKPTVEMVAFRERASMLLCWSAGHALFEHLPSRSDLLPSATAPKIDPTATPATPTPRATIPGTYVGLAPAFCGSGGVAVVAASGGPKLNVTGCV